MKQTRLETGGHLSTSLVCPPRDRKRNSLPIVNLSVYSDSLGEQTVFIWGPWFAYTPIAHELCW